jgi:hypothetical protein
MAATLAALFKSFRDRDWQWNEQYAKSRPVITDVERCARVLAFHERYLLAQSMHERYVTERQCQHAQALSPHTPRVTAGEIEFFEERIALWRKRFETELKLLKGKTE